MWSRSPTGLSRRPESTPSITAALPPVKADRAAADAAAEPRVSAPAGKDVRTMTETPVPIGILTISDRASRGAYEDLSGPAIERELARLLVTPWRPVRRIVPDERPEIEGQLVALCDVEGCSLVVTTGGTGPAPRDVTPEATEAICELRPSPTAST